LRSLLIGEEEGSMKKLLACFVLLVVSASAHASPPNADSLPVEGLAPYAPYRSILIEHGWKPQELPNAYIDGLPEVLCGSGLCTASWDAPSGTLVEFTLWRDAQDHLVLAPESD
jgi:hypothetical protein